jgi:hypothetical protein
MTDENINLLGPSFTQYFGCKPNSVTGVNHVIHQDGNLYSACHEWNVTRPKSAGTHLALDITDQQLHLIWLILINIGVRDSCKTVGNRDGAICHAHMEAVGHATTPAEQIPTEITLYQGCARDRSVGGRHVELAGKRARCMALVASLPFTID